jgi:DNA-directed RNA polymerase specialized sigma24 family protein
MAKPTEQLILEKLDQLLRVLTISVTKGMKQNEQITLLDRAGFPPKEIATLLGTTSNTVSVALSNLRKAKGDSSSKSGKRVKKH